MYDYKWIDFRPAFYCLTAHFCHVSLNFDLSFLLNYVTNARNGKNYFRLRILLLTAWTESIKKVSRNMMDCLNKSSKEMWQDWVSSRLNITHFWEWFCVLVFGVTGFVLANNVFIRVQRKIIVWIHVAVKNSLIDRTTLFLC